MTGNSAISAASARRIPFGRPTWNPAVLVGLLALFTSPLWFRSTPAGLLALAFWIALEGLALLAGRRWGHSLHLHSRRRRVVRAFRGPGMSSVIWSYDGDGVDSLFLERLPQDRARLHAAFRDGRRLLIKTGDEAELQKLGEALAGCWRVRVRA
jgi:hypothetical protein